MVEPLTKVNLEFFKSTFKHLSVRSRQGQSQSIMISSMSITSPRNFPISSLNHYDKKLKKQIGSVCLNSKLECIDEENQEVDSPSGRDHFMEENIVAPMRLQINRNRSQSEEQNSLLAPVLQPVINFGHTRNSNLFQKSM